MCILAWPCPQIATRHLPSITHRNVQAPQDTCLLTVSAASSVMVSVPQVSAGRAPPWAPSLTPMHPGPQVSCPCP